MCISSRHLYLRVDQHGNHALVLSGCVCVSTGLFFHDFPLHGIRETLRQGTRSRWNRPEVTVRPNLCEAGQSLRRIGYCHRGWNTREDG